MGGKTPDWMPELFFCHRYDFCVVAEELGFRLGTRSDQFDTNQTQRLLDDGYEVEFVDNDFEDPDYERLEKIVEKTGAKFAVLPDIYDMGSVDRVVSFGEKLVTEYDVTPIVVPKCEFEHSQIPSSWIMGFSVPSGYGETDIPIQTFTDHRVHLLGGSPRKQIQYANKLVNNDLSLFSIDGNAFSKASGYGTIINEPVEMIDSNGELDEKSWVKSAEGFTDWGQRIAFSLARYYELWRQWSLRRGLAGPDIDVASNV